MKLKLFARYAIIFSSLVLVIVILLGGSMLYQHSLSYQELSNSSLEISSSELLEQMEQRGKVITTLLAENLVNPLYLLDMDVLRETLAATIAHDDVIFAYIFDENGKILHDGTNMAAMYGQIIEEMDILTGFPAGKCLVNHQDNSIMAISCLIHLGDDLLGGIKVGLSLKMVEQHLVSLEKNFQDIRQAGLQKTMRWLTISIITLLLAGLAIAFVIARKLAYPIQELAKSAASIGRGNYDIAFPRVSKDEIGELVTSFEQMARDLKKSTVSVAELQQEISKRQNVEEQLVRAQKMEAIGMLVGGVAHDLNNILSALIGYPDLLLLQVDENSPIRDNLLTIQKSGQKAADIVQDLLTLARRGVSVFDVINVNDLIDDYLKSPEFRKMAADHPHVSVETKLSPGLANVLGSPTHFSKTIMNLVHNAAEAMPDGGTVTITTENRQLNKPQEGYSRIEEGDYAVISVADTGIGLSEKEQKKIFEPFFTKKKMGKSGSGLGMTIIWATVKDHGGYIDLQSEKGRGTTFQLYIPATAQEMETGASPVNLEDLQGHGETILIVDDMQEQREIASSMLRELSYVADTVSSGEEAVEYIQKTGVDLLVLDMLMEPGIDGLKTYRKILNIRPGQKAIIVSGFSRTDRVKELLQLGGAAYVKKPYRLEQLGTAVKKALAGGVN